MAYGDWEGWWFEEIRQKNGKLDIYSGTNSKIKKKRLTLGIMYFEWLGISLLLLLCKCQYTRFTLGYCEIKTTSCGIL